MLYEGSTRRSYMAALRDEVLSGTARLQEQSLKAVEKLQKDEDKVNYFGYKFST